MQVTINEKFYGIVYTDGSHQTVRRDTYWDNGWKDPIQIDQCKRIERMLSQSNGIKVINNV